MPTSRRRNIQKRRRFKRGRTKAHKSRGLGGGIHRAVEVVFGLIILLVGVPLAVVCAAAGVTVVVESGRHELGRALVFVAAGLVFLPFLAITGWRLVTGRQRRGGGLFNPAMVDSLGVLLAPAAVARTTLWYGPEMGGLRSEGLIKARDEVSPGVRRWFWPLVGLGAAGVIALGIWRS